MTFRIGHFNKVITSLCSMISKARICPESMSEDDMVAIGIVSQTSGSGIPRSIKLRQHAYEF